MMDFQTCDTAQPRAETDKGAVELALFLLLGRFRDLTAFATLFIADAGRYVQTVLLGTVNANELHPQACHCVSRVF